VRETGIRVVDTRTGQPITYARALVRVLAFALSVYALPLGLVSLAWVVYVDTNAQSVHDKIASTVVVKRAAPLRQQPTAIPRPRA